MPRATLTHCPACDYDLRGLPGRYRCPECGFEYDEGTLVWRPRTRNRVYLWGPLCLMLCVGVLTRAYHLFNIRPVRTSDISILIICALGLVWTLAWLYHLRHGGSFVAVTRRGVWARNYRGLFFAAWRQVRDVSNTLGVPAVYCHGKVVGFELDGVFESRDEIAEFYNAVAACRDGAGSLERWSAPDSAPAGMVPADGRIGRGRTGY